MNSKELIALYNAGDRNFVGVDLKNAGLDWPCFIGIDLRSADLRGARFRARTRLINAKLSDANMEKVSLAHVFLINANLSNANLKEAHLVGADLTGADLTGADLTGADLTDAVLIGTNLTGTNLTDIKTTKDTIFCQTIMPDGRIQTDSERLTDEGEFIRRYTEGEREFRHLILHQVDLSGVNLCGVSFLWQTRLSYVNLSGANLTNCNFRGIKRLVFSDLRNAQLINCEWRNPQIIYCDLRAAHPELFNMYAPDFTGSNLEGSQAHFDIEEDMYFCNTTWVTGEFIPGPINSSERWLERPQRIRKDRF